MKQCLFPQSFFKPPKYFWSEGVRFSAECRQVVWVSPTQGELEKKFVQLMLHNELSFYFTVEPLKGNRNLLEKEGGGGRGGGQKV